MGQKVLVGPFSKGLRNDVLPFNVDNDSFPKLVNAYQWRGRIKRKRGTTQLGRLQRYFDSTSPLSTGVAINPIFTITFNGSGDANLLGPYTNATPVSFSLQANGAIVPGSVTITGSVGPVVYTDPTKDGFLTPTGTGGVNTINYSSGVIHIPAQAGGTATVQMIYYPDLPVMGLEELLLDPTADTLELGFDTVYAYNIPVIFPYTPYSVSWYKNPISFGTYVQKTISTPLIWNGQDYQQFWTTNYQGAFWAANGITQPFDTAHIGMQFKRIMAATVISATDVDFTTTNNHPFVPGDWVFINEVDAITGLNYETGFVLAAPAPTATTFRARFPTATIAGGPATTGIVQALTTSCDPDISSTTPTNGRDCVRWYDGDPTSGPNHLPPTPPTGKGWVNFCPPLNSFSDNPTFSISDLPPGQYYLSGARMIVPYKDRLLFLGPVVQTATLPPVYLPDTVIYSQNGTPFYTASFPYSTADFTPTPMIVYNPLLVPVNQTAQPVSFWGNPPGFGGFIQAGLPSAITTVGFNEDVLIVGFSRRQTRLIYSGNDIIPFSFYSINTELGSESTFSSIILDRGVMTVGGRGVIITSQTASERTDLLIPDQIFEFNLRGNGAQRVTAQRDFINEWIYFTYKPSDSTSVFPSQTLLYNYRDASWAIFNETYTTYGTFRKKSGQNWDDLTEFTWDEWDDIWDSGEQTLLQPEVIGGNGQGFIMFLAEGVGEDASGYIKSIDANSVVTSPNHCLTEGDYIVISGALGTISSQINGNIYSVANPTLTTFTLNPTIPSIGTYLGNGVFTRMYVPFVQTRQFPVAWEMTRKTRLGQQQYLFSKTALAQVTIQIYLSQNETNPINAGPIVPSALSDNNSLVYSDVLYTCPEATNLGLSPGNINLQELTMVDSTGMSTNNQAQIWHRMNTSLLGDTVQIGLTLSDTQMRQPLSSSAIASPKAITGATKSNPCVLSCVAGYTAGSVIFIKDVLGMTELNNRNFVVVSSSATTVTIEVDSTSFSTYTSGGTATLVTQNNQFAEIELHSFVLDVTPSQMLS